MVDESTQNEDTDTSEEAASEENKEGKGGGRMNAAKAFYRAMYAGAEPDPEDFGLTDKQAGGGGGGARSGPCQNCAYLENNLKEAEAKTTEAESLYKRMAADFENYRKRIDREREEFQALGVQKAVEALLPALDDLDMAQTRLKPDQDPKVLIDSIKMVYSRFTRCLDQIGIKQLEVIGTPFDPRLHEPVQEIATNEVPDGSVVHQLRPGYTFNDKVIRPSLVNVATKLEGEEPAIAAEEPRQDETIPPGAVVIEPELTVQAVHEEEGHARATQDLPVVELSESLTQQPDEAPPKTVYDITDAEESDKETSDQLG